MRLKTAFFEKKLPESDVFLKLMNLTKEFRRCTRQYGNIRLEKYIDEMMSLLNDSLENETAERKEETVSMYDSHGGGTIELFTLQQEQNTTIDKDGEIVIPLV